MRLFSLVMASDAVLYVIYLSVAVIRCVRIMASRTLQTLLRFEIALATQHANGLKPRKCIGIVTQFLLGDAAWQTMAITAELNLGFTIPGIRAN